MFDFIVLGACAVRLSQVGRHVCFSPGVGGFVSDGSTVLYSVKESGEVVIGVDDGPVAWPSERGRPLVLMAVPETFFFAASEHFRFPSLWTPICRPRLWWLHLQ